MILFSDRMKLITSYRGPNVRVETTGRAQAARGQLAEILGVPVVQREPRVQTEYGNRKAPGAVGWVLGGKEWQLTGCRRRSPEQTQRALGFPIAPPRALC